MIVGTAGHIDHGKTALVRALTGVDTDRLKEEKARGITIELGFAYWPQADGGIIGFVDVPGHERFVHTMAAGDSGIDLLLLVVAADDGVMPQTREHLEIARLFGVRRAVVALSKADLADATRREEVAAEIAALLAPTPLAGAPIVPVSTVTGEGVAELGALLQAEAASARMRSAAGRFRLAVDRCFTLAGAGTVVTGTVLSGTVAVGDTVTVSPSGLSARIRSIHAQNRPAERGRAGDRCALNLAGPTISKDAVRRGDMVVDPALHMPTARIDAELTLLASEPRRLTMWTPVRLHHASTEVGARVVLLQDAALEPGTTAKVQLVLDQPIAAAALDRFVLRDTSASRTIGGGRFLDLRGAERRRRTPQRLAQLEAMAIEDPAASIARQLAAEPRHLDLAAFERDRALGAEAAADIARRLGLVLVPIGSGRIAFLPGLFAGLSASIKDALRSYHAASPDVPGMGLERLRGTLDLRLPAPVFRAVLAQLAAAGAIAVEGAWVRMPEHEARLTPADEALWSRLAPMLGGAERFRPPRVRDVAATTGVPEEAVRRVMKLVARRGDLHEVAQDHFFLKPVMAEIVGIAMDLVAQHADGFNAAQLRDRLANGRKVAIQILEFLDRHGVTIRRGDLRRTNRQRLDLFVPPGDADPGREASPVGRPGFKPGRGRQTVLGGFDSHSLPPDSVERHL